MTDDPKKQGHLIENSFYDDVKLPPMADDAMEEVDPAILADYLDNFEDDQPKPKTDLNLDNSENATVDFIDSDEGSWLDNGGQTHAPEGIELDDDNQASWSTDSTQAFPAIEDNWFTEEEPTPLASADKGDDGPMIDADMEIDSSNWENLDNWEDTKDEPVEKVMERLGISLPQAEDDSQPPPKSDLAPEPDPLVDVQFLGPLNGQIVAISVKSDILIAVGSGLFMIGADGMLHQINASTELNGTSVCSHDDFTFIGTSNQGALMMSGTDSHLTPINAWNMLGVGDKSDSTVATSFDIIGQPQDNNSYRLLGSTKGGQLFASLDLGLTWFGPLTPERCLAKTVISNTEEVLVLTRSGDGAQLLRSCDLEHWEKINIPANLEKLVRKGNVTLAANSKTFVIGLDNPDVPLFYSLDSAETWQSNESIKNVTALTLDIENPGCILAATYHSQQGQGQLRISRDGGHEWKTLLVTGKHNSPKSPTDGKIRQIVANINGTHPEVFVVSGEGVHHLVLSDTTFAH